MLLLSTAHTGHELAENVDCKRCSFLISIRLKGVISNYENSLDWSDSIIQPFLGGV